MHAMETILEFLKRRLNEAGSANWESIAREAGVKVSVPRKIVWDKTRENPGVKIVQPLLDYFHKIDLGEPKLPAAEDKQAA